MPTITVSRNDLYRLAGLEADYPLSALDYALDLVKGELKPVKEASAADAVPEEDIPLRIELADTNRPDLWCVEGIARQLRDHRRGCGQPYNFYTRDLAPRRIRVDPRLQDVRPYIGGFLAEGGSIDETGLLAFIECQEALDRNYGRRRKAVSIGLYDGRRVQFPVNYGAVGWDEATFVPLPPSMQLKDGSPWPMGQAMTPREILAKHPTGQEYAWTLDTSQPAPLLVDAVGQVLSLIPIINSAGAGRVTLGADALFVEASGMDLDQVLLTLNILAANLSDRGWTIQPVTTEYLYVTPRGPQVTSPHIMPVTRRVPLELFERVLGESLSAQDVVEKLTAYGVTAAFDGDQITATAPSYRQDYLHPVDVTEDYAISRGFQTFEPLLPGDFTVGQLTPLTEFEDLLRDWMIGFGFEETYCNILDGEENLRRRMDVGCAPEQSIPPFHGGPTVHIQNVMNLNYADLRDWILPSLMQIESHSEGAVYPHHLFEVGEVAVFDAADSMGSRTESRLAALIADETATFDAAQSVLYALLNAIHLPFRVVPWDHPSFIPGRVGLIVAGETGARDDPAAWLGFLGEFSPQVLTHWGLRVPAVGLELSIHALQRSIL